MTARFSKEFDNDFESILKQINLENLSKPMEKRRNSADDYSTMRVDKDGLLVYGNRAWSDRAYLVPNVNKDSFLKDSIVSLTSDLAAILHMQQKDELDKQANYKPKPDNVPCLDLSPILVE